MSASEKAFGDLRAVLEGSSDEALHTLGGIIDNFPWHDGTAPARPAFEVLQRAVVAVYMDRLGEPYDLDQVMEMISNG